MSTLNADETLVKNEEDTMSLQDGETEPILGFDQLSDIGLSCDDDLQILLDQTLFEVAEQTDFCEGLLGQGHGVLDRGACEQRRLLNGPSRHSSRNKSKKKRKRTKQQVSAYNLFFQEECDRIGEDLIEKMESEELASVVATRWANLEGCKRSEYKRRAKVESALTASKKFKIDMDEESQNCEYPTDKDFSGADETGMPTEGGIQEKHSTPNTATPLNYAAATPEERERERTVVSQTPKVDLVCNAQKSLSSPDRSILSKGEKEEKSRLVLCRQSSTAEQCPPSSWSGRSARAFLPGISSVTPTSSISYHPSFMQRSALTAAPSSPRASLGHNDTTYSPVWQPHQRHMMAAISNGQEIVLQDSQTRRPRRYQVNYTLQRMKAHEVPAFMAAYYGQPCWSPRPLQG